MGERGPGRRHGRGLEPLAQGAARERPLLGECSLDDPDAALGIVGRHALDGQAPRIGRAHLRCRQGLQPRVVLAPDEVQRSAIEPCDQERSVERQRLVDVGDGESRRPRADRQLRAAQILRLDAQEPLGHDHGIVCGRACEPLGGEALGEHHGMVQHRRHGMVADGPRRVVSCAWATIGIARRSAWRSSSSALSLGIDLGFGQPMEHVLRQCLIALRLAERLGLDERDARGRVLHGAACQRRLPLRCARAGEVVRRRHRPEGDEVRPRWLAASRSVVSMVRRLGAGNPPLHRLRVGLEFAVSGRREFLGVVADHAAHRRSARRAARAARRGQREPRRCVRALGRPRLARWAEGRPDPARLAARAARGVRRGRASRRRDRGGDRARAAAQRDAVRPGDRGAAVRRVATRSSPSSTRSTPGRP